MAEIRLSQLIAQPFYPVHQDIRREAYSEYWLKGGRGSTKSSFISLEIVKGMREMVEGLVKIGKHNITCKVCAPRQGRVYRIIDFPAGDGCNAFPHISQGMPRCPTYKTIHVSCKRRLLPYVWSQKSDKEKQAALRDAGKPVLVCATCAAYMGMKDHYS